MITPADFAGYQAKAKGKKLPAGTLTKKGAPISAPEEQLAWQLTGADISHTREFRFHPRRKYRADFFIPPLLLVEVQGSGRHTRFLGYENDMERQAEALMLGFVVLPVTPRQVTNGKALAWIQAILTKLRRRMRNEP